MHCFNNAIKRCYWFGTVNIRGISTPTTSLYPTHYCNFNHHSKSAEEGYFELPETVDVQCNHHRSGIACGDCSPGYTLYDMTLLMCIDEDNCTAGMAVLVITLIIVLVGVFSFMNMFFKYEVSLGYMYGIIYYYSLVGILLDNNSYSSDGAFLGVSILASFAQLTPQFLGQLCLVKRDWMELTSYLSTTHMPLLFHFIVRAARCSIGLKVFVNHSIL